MAMAMNEKRHKTRFPGMSLVQDRSSTVYNVVFTNRKLFPSFLELPNEEIPNPIYYRQIIYGGFVPIRPWFFLGEITDARLAQSEWARHRIYVRDIDGQEQINIDFYPDSRRVDTFDYSLFKQGHTVCINFGSQHYFLDGKHGIRVENYKKVQVFPISLDTLLTTVSNEMKENMPLHQREKPSQGETLTYLLMKKTKKLKKFLPPSPHCWNCKKTETDELKMKRCAKCTIATYCQKSCQIEHWNASHKQSCKCLRFYTPMVTGIKTALNNMSQYLWDLVSTDDDNEDDDGDKNNNDDDDDFDYYFSLITISYLQSHINDQPVIHCNMSNQKPKQNISTSSKGAGAIKTSSKGAGAITTSAKGAGVITTSSKGAGAITTASSDAIHPRQRITQNFLLIWVDASIDESTKGCQNILAQLRSVVNDVNIFTKPNQCTQFINELKDEKAFVIISGSLGEHLVPEIHALPQLDAIYIFCGNKSLHEKWTKKWNKIKGIHVDIKPICQALQLARKHCNQDSIAVSFVTASEGASNQNLNQLEPSFMYTQIFKEILLEMEYDEKSIKDLAIYCRKFYNNNTSELTVIDEFEHNYQSKSAIWWYTRECFTYQMLNRALRTLEADTIIKMGFFIRDLHQQIQLSYEKQVGSYHEKSFIVYRGQGLFETDFEKLLKSKGGLMSFNNFLSTSKDRNVSLAFAQDVLTRTNTVGILFKMFINPSLSSAPFASVGEMSYFQMEEEILFSMHTVFRISEINKIDNNSSLYQVDLNLTADDDEQLRTLTERIRQDVVGATGWRRLGNLLLTIGQFEKAEELYHVLLEQTSDEVEKAIYYTQLGYIKNNQGDLEKAIMYYEKGLEIKHKTLDSDHPSLANSYNNIGMVYTNMKEYSKALSLYEKALEIQEKALPPNPPSLATCYNNIGGVYRNMGEHSKALSFYEKDLEISQKILPPNHPNLAASYNNIGGVYNNMGEYSKALSFYEKDLEISQKTLLANHPSLATSYNNIASVYYSTGEYSKALAYFERALDIKQRSLPPNHPSIQDVRQNIEIVKKKL